ncbi:MAG TPA: hemolysin III family protein [Rhizomicrobium sp.]|nr:hemolysin III family protein [Rhizomicrobium sp.]
MNAKAARIYSTIEHRADAVIHVIGILFAINATSWLIASVTDASASVIVSVSVYCLGLLAMIGLSAAYNLTPHHRPFAKQVLRRLDHAAIFIMIAATYTPFAANRLGFATGSIILALIWCTATFGVVMKLVFPHRFERASIVLYIAMGWMIVTVMQPLSASLAAVDFWLLIAGGLIYSAGVAFYVIERIPFHKAIWHGFVLAAAIVHFSAIAIEFVH